MFWLTHPVLSINLFVYSLIPSLTNKSNLTSLFKHFPKKFTPRTRSSVTKNKLSELVTPIFWLVNDLEISWCPHPYMIYCIFPIGFLNDFSPYVEWTAIYMAKIMLIWHKTLNNQSICLGQWIGISKMSGVQIQVATDLSLVKTGNYSSTAKCFATGLSVTGPQSWPSQQMSSVPACAAGAC